MGDILHAEDFGAIGDGVADDTAALVALFAQMQAQGKPGMLGGEGETRYLVQAGALEWTFINSEARFTASMTGAVMTVTAIEYGTINVGRTVTGDMRESSASSFTISSQLTGTAGGTGTYAVTLPVGHPDPIASTIMGTNLPVPIESPGPAGPVLETAGKVTLVAKLGSPDRAMLAIHNDPAVGSRYIHGGYIGDLRFEDNTGDTAPNRHGLELYGVNYIHVGNLYSSTTKGDLLHLRRRGSNTSGDAWHVAGCTFNSLTLWGGDGWALNNNTVSQVFNLCRIGPIWCVGNQKGASRGSGAANIYEAISVTDSCRDRVSFAIDWTTNEGSVQGCVLQGAELDAPSRAFRIQGLQAFHIGSCRITYRRGPVTGFHMDAGERWPLEGLVMDDGGGPQVVTDGHIQLVHRIDATVTEDSQLPTACVNYGGTSSVSRVHVDNIWSVGAAPSFTPSTSRFIAHVNTSSHGNVATLNGVPVFSNRLRGALKTRATAAVVVPDFTTATSIGSSTARIAFNSTEYDQTSNYALGLYTCQATGKYRIRAGLTFAADADGDEVQLGIFQTAAILRAVSYRAKGTNAQTYTIEAELSCVVNDTLGLHARHSGTGNNAVFAVDGTNAIYSNYLEIEFIS